MHLHILQKALGNKVQCFPYILFTWPRKIESDRESQSSHPTWQTDCFIQDLINSGKLFCFYLNESRESMKNNGVFHISGSRRHKGVSK